MSYWSSDVCSSDLRAVLDLGAGIAERLDAYLAREPSSRTIVHGDLRIDNILFAPCGDRCWLVDWQTLGRGSGASDLAYLVGTSIADPGERAAADRPAFDHWIRALRQRGVAPDAAGDGKSKRLNSSH